MWTANNLSVLVSHVECAAFELPFADGETFGRADIDGVLKFLGEEKMLYHSKENLPGESVPPRDILPHVATFDENPVFIEPDFEPNIFIDDNYAGGIGLSHALFYLEKNLLKHGLKTIGVCPCKEGCPSCVAPARETGRQAKQVAQEILRGLLEE